MKIINNKFVESNKNISECGLLTHSTHLNDIILLYTNRNRVLLFNYEKCSKSYSTDVYYEDKCYKIILKKQKTSSTYICYIYFDDDVPYDIRIKISKRLCTIIDVPSVRGYENGPDFNKILSALMDHYYEHYSTDLSKMLDMNKSDYNYIKSRLNYKCDLSNRTVNCDIQNMLLLVDGVNVYEYNDREPDLIECFNHFYISENKIIPGYCFKYIPSLKQYIVSEDEREIIIEFDNEQYEIYNGAFLESYISDETVLFEFDGHYIIGYKVDD